MRLTWGEVYRAGEAALWRTVKDLKDGLKDAYGAEKDDGLGLEKGFVGCIAETAVAKHFGIYWRPFEFGIVDVGPYEVRGTTNQRGRLILHPRTGDRGDRDENAFILAYVLKTRLPVVTLVGWIMGRDGKIDEWWGEANPNRPNGRPAYWVPPGELHDIRLLSA